jgi:chorismate mutase
MQEIEKYRKEIDRVDEKIIELLQIRTAIVYKISRYKARHNILAIDKKRENEVLKRVQDLAIKHYIDDNFAKKVYEVIIEECRKIQRIKR